MGVSDLNEQRAFNLREMKMRAQNWTDIMTLLAVMTASNKMDKRAELAMFKHAALDLRDMFAPNIKLTESFAADWMTENRTEIQTQTTSVHFDASVKRLRKNLDVLANKNEILTIIMKWTLSETPHSRQDQLRFKYQDNESQSNTNFVRSLINDHAKMQRFFSAA